MTEPAPARGDKGRPRCPGETPDGKQCRRLARKTGELVTRMEGWAGQRLYCPEHAAEWERALPNISDREEGSENG